MKIIHLLSDKDWSGAAQFILDTATQLLAEGHETEVVVRRDSEAYQRLRNAGINCITASIGGALDIITPILLSRHLRRNGSAILHTHSFKDAICAARARALAPENVGKIIVSPRDGAPADINAPYASLYDVIDHIIFPSESSRGTFLSSGVKYDNKKITIIPQAVKLPDDSPSAISVKNPDKITLMWHGRITADRSLEVLLQAAKLLRDVDYRLIIVGSGEGRIVMPLIRYARTNALADRIDWRGSVNNVHALIPEADIGIFTGLPIGAYCPTILEYMAHGIPVIATQCDTVSHLMENNRHGLLVPSYSPEALADAIRRLSGDRKLRETLGAEGAKNISEHASFSRMYSQLVDVYKS